MINIGKSFNKWTVIQYEGKNEKGRHVYECICTCGFSKIVPIYNLISGRSKQCRSCHLKKINNTSCLLGIRFGKWLVSNKILNVKYNSYFYECICDCGNVSKVSRYALINEKSTCCNICKKEKSITHNSTNSTTYYSWKSMKQRCLYDKFIGFKYYGGRGITICNEWIISFESFLNDMGIKPEGMSLDRIDNDGNYEPSNCRWATSKQQLNNRRKIKRV